MQLEPMALPLPPTFAQDYPYLQSSLPLNVQDLFPETDGRELGDVLKGAVLKVSALGDGELQSEIDRGVVKCKLAPAFGSLSRLDNPAYKKMDDATIIMLWVSLRRLDYAQRIEHKVLTFKIVEEIFLKNPFLELDRGQNVDSEIALPLEEVEFWKFWPWDDSERKAVFRRNVCKLVQEWFKNLVKDQDIRSTTDIPLNDIQDILTRTSSDVNAKLDDGERWEKTFLDIGVLRFPDITNPYIRVYHIQLHAWAQCQNGLLRETARNGATGEFRLREYKPRTDIIEGLKEEVRKIAVDQGEQIIHSLAGGFTLAYPLN